jgi:hypothetical protein
MQGTGITRKTRSSKRRKTFDDSAWREHFVKIESNDATRADIAKRLGCSKMTVGRNFNLWKKTPERVFGRDGAPPKVTDAILTKIANLGAKAASESNGICPDDFPDTLQIVSARTAIAEGRKTFGFTISSKTTSTASTRRSSRLRRSTSSTRYAWRQ